MDSWHLHIKGQVQGVGFRPLVYQLAQKFHLMGWVKNSVDGVHVVFNADNKQASFFVEALISQAPPLARITSHILEQTKPQIFSDFQIVHSQDNGHVNLMLTPDFAICDNCRSELSASENRRQNYPFITCTHCGPRFSITRRLPYDRKTTSMKRFGMCPGCQREYRDPLDRRYYSQTNSCPTCAIALSLINKQLDTWGKDPALIIQKVAQLWDAGHILAIKGIGGYLLCCDAGNPEAIRKLRERKHRPNKPFALMYPSLQVIDQDLELHEAAKAEMISHRSPIVLLSVKAGHSLKKTKELIAPGLTKIGVMLPYTPLYELLLRTFGRPVVATSGNISNAPIVFEDKKAKESLLQIADYLLLNDREIVVPQDDSVVQYSPFYQKKILLRRSRGMAPSYFGKAQEQPTIDMLATGAMLKSTFALSHRGNTYISQYLGDLQNFTTEESFRHTLEHFLQLLATHPEIILVDKHPDYASTRLGVELAERFKVPVEKIQHHIAHFGAILGEHQLLEHPEPVLGVIWDGTGLGDDGHIWGGEFFLFADQTFTRQGHFEYFDFFLGDKMPKEPRIAAFSLCEELEEARILLRPKFTATEWSLYRKILAAPTALQTSSVGRLFDAVAALLGLGDRQTYEGEVATRLEQLATSYFRKHGRTFSECYISTLPTTARIPTKALMAGIIKDLRAGMSEDYIAAKFHFSLVEVIKLIADQLQVYHIACSGGVFQNGLLLDLLQDQLAADYRLYFHRELSPNDECVSFGQLMCYQIKQQNSYKHVLSDSR